jgi:ketosteroid isomerase-like protein
MGEAVTSDLDQRARELLQTFDALDFTKLADMLADDAQGIDEISRRWLRSRAELDEYFRQLSGAVADVRSELSDLVGREYGDVGVVTCMLDQSYMLEGRRVQIKAPTTIVFTRRGGDWRATLVHSVPLSDAD